MLIGIRGRTGSPDPEKPAEVLEHMDKLSVNHIQRVFAAKREMLAEVIAFIEGKLEEAGCPMKTLMQITVAAEEAFINVASYSYPESEGTVTVDAEITDEPRTLVLTFTDQGIPYDPLAKADPDVTAAAEDRQIGGLGIYMFKKLMDEVSYEYRDGKNILTMKKSF